VEVDAQKPTVYYYFSQAYLQRNRPAGQLRDLVLRPGGKEGAVVARATSTINRTGSLDGKGKPFMIDVITTAGATIFSFPTKAACAQKFPSLLGLSPSSPVAAESLFGERSGASQFGMAPGGKDPVGSGDPWSDTL